MAGEYSNKVVVVTGGSRGSGKGIALAFARQGARTVLAASSAERLAEAAASIAAEAGSDPVTVVGDLRTAEGCARLAATVGDRFGQCDILVNNAGATRAGDYLTIPDDAWIDGFALKFHGAVRVTRALWPLLKASQGRVVNIVGGAGRTPDTEFLIGASVNAAMSAWSKGLSKLGMRDGVNVNAILPGATATERSEELLQQRAAAQGKSVDEVRAAILARTGIRRMGMVEDIAALALFLCSDQARHIQGTAIAVDGGATPGLY